MNRTSVAIVYVLILVSTVAAVPARAQSPESAISCSADQLVVPSNKPPAVTLAASFPGLSSEGWRFSWSVSQGEVEDKGSGTGLWQLGPLPKIGDSTAELIATRGNSRITCKTGVFVSSILDAPFRRVLHEFLSPDQTEQPGYALYSYVLAPQPPRTAEDRSRLGALLRSVVDMGPRVQALEARIGKSEINATYIPMRLNQETVEADLKSLERSSSTVATGSNPGRTSLPASALSDLPGLQEWLLENYNYARANELVQDAQLSIDGLYIVTLPRRPLTDASVVGRPYVFQDFSRVLEDRTISQWVVEFVRQTSQARYDKQDPLVRLQLAIRNAISVGGTAVKLIAPGVFR